MPLVVSSNLGILNPPSGSKATDTFRHFKRLPLELRWHIWEFELKHERLLHVEAHPLEASPDDPSTESGTCPERTYEIILTEFLPISKLARVNSESRAVASHFYRVQLPCVYRWEGKEDTNGICYFNPELDTLEIRGNAFSNFAEDLWVHDARHVGLINLALSMRQLIPESRAEYPLLQRIIPRLKRVMFLCRGGSERIYFGEQRPTDPIDKIEVFRARPIMPATPKFDRLLCDPRLHIETSLKKIHLDYYDPRRLIHYWFRLMTKCNVQHDHEVDYRFLVALGRRCCRPYAQDNEFGSARGWRVRLYEHNPEITDQDSALSWVRKQEERRRETLREMREKEEGEASEQPLEGLELPLQPAIGFWLFPIEALGPLPDVTRPFPWNMAPISNRGSHRKVDLSGYKPQLCLSYLP